MQPGQGQQPQVMQSNAATSAVSVSGTSKAEVTGPPGDRHLVVHLAPGGQGAVVAESGSMVWFDSGLSISATTIGGIKKALLRSVAGESIFMTRFSNPTDNALAAAFAPDYPCDVVEIDVPSRSKYNVAAGAFLAAEEGILVSGSLSLKAGIFGQGDIMSTTLVGHEQHTLKAWIASNGVAERHDLDAGQQLVVDNHRVLLSTGGETPQIITVGGIRNAITSGEGMAMLFTGPCTVWTQTRRSFRYLVEEITSKNDNKGSKGFSFSLSGGLGDAYPNSKKPLTKRIHNKKRTTSATTTKSRQSSKYTRDTQR